MRGAEDYIGSSGAPPLGAMARRRSPSLFYAVNHPAMTYGHVGCASFGGFRSLPSGRRLKTEPQGSGMFDK